MYFYSPVEKQQKENNMAKHAFDKFVNKAPKGAKKKEAIRQEKRKIKEELRKKGEEERRINEERYRQITPKKSAGEKFGKPEARIDKDEKTSFNKPPFSPFAVLFGSPR